MKHLSVTCTRDTAETFSLTIREDIGNLLIGYAEITLVPGGARIEAWNADDSDVGDNLVIRQEAAS